MSNLPPLADRLGPHLEVLFVGINPGIRSSQTGHHFAGYSNRFWKLLFDAGLTPRPVSPVDDDVLPSWGFGLTNLVARPTRGIDALTPAEYQAGRARLERKIRRVQPKVVALAGVTLARRLLPVTTVTLGLQSHTLAGAAVFVLPNPSGRNAHHSYAEMLEALRALAAYIGRPGRKRSARRAATERRR